MTNVSFLVQVSCGSRILHSSFLILHFLLRQPNFQFSILIFPAAAQFSIFNFQFSILYSSWFFDASCLIKMKSSMVNASIDEPP